MGGGDVLLGVGGDGDVVLVVAAVGDMVIDEEFGEPGGIELEPGAHFWGVGFEVIAVEVEAAGGDAEAHGSGSVFVDAVVGGSVLVAVGVEDGDGEEDDVVEPGGVAFGDEDVAQEHHGGVLAAVLAGVDAVLKEDDGECRFCGRRRE